ncbi:unnamed protein product, partial [Thlaspi arvense]
MGICEMKSCCSWLLLISLLSALSNEIQAISSDGEALLIFRDAVSRSDSFIHQWRPEDPDPCKWNGVTCDAKTKRVITLNLTYHKINGLLPPELGRLDHLRLLMLHNNGLYGPIPTTLRNCTALEGIFLQSNYLSGAIPAEMGDLSGLQKLDMSSNSLSGSIPASLGQLKKLTNFNVSNNFLVGQIPPDGVLSGFSKNSFIGNRKLCGKQIDVVCQDDSGNPSSNSQSTGQNQKKNSGKLLISASATVGALLLVALMCFWGCFLYKKLGKVESKSLAMDVGGGASIVMFHGDLPYSSKDIIKKLEMLNEEHIIGCGGFGTVYKLAMDDGNVFALKRIVKLNEGFDRFFERELEILGSIKHRYLVNLRGYCNSPTSKLLLYDYLPGGSLDEALHERGEQLDWDSRLKFLISENKPREIVVPNCEGMQIESLDALLSIATQCVSSVPEERPTMHRVVQLLESEVMTPCPSDFYDSSSD